jgi:hypothetical protein
MPRGAVRLTGNWAGFERALEGRTFNAAARKNMRRAMGLVGVNVARSVRDQIQKGRYQPNAALTVALKGSNEPLKGKRTGELWQAITHQVIDDFTVFVGVLRSHGDYNIAAAVHQGTTIGVTSKMRAMFFALWKMTIGVPGAELTSKRAQQLWEWNKVWYPISRATKAIVIPARPFMTRAFRSQETKQIVKKILTEALDATFQELVK